MRLVISTSLKKDGSMGIKRNLNGAVFVRNRRRFFNKLGIDELQTVKGVQVHGSNIEIVRRAIPAKIIPKTDALITNQVDTFLFILHADCFPVFLYDKKRKAVGIAHAGWRGVIKSIVPKAVRKFKTVFKTNLKDLEAIIGPGIERCHFEVKEDILPQFKSYSRHVIKREGKTFIDLVGILKEQFVKSGVPSKNITKSGGCTYHQRRYFSYRRTKEPANMLSIIGFKS